MDEQVKRFEDAVVNLAQTIISDHVKALRRAGITRETVEITRPDDEGGGYQSEIEIMFWKGDDLFDVLECFLFQEGRSSASQTEIGTWLHEQIKELTRELS